MTCRSQPWYERSPNQLRIRRPVQLKTAHAPERAVSLSARQSGPLTGRVRPPGDKSISHRAFILGLLSVGETRIEGVLEGDDVLRTGEACRALGASVERVGEGSWRVRGRGILVRFDGDASLRKRPMRRILDPLVLMGAEVMAEAEGGRCPILLQGTHEPAPIEYRT